MRAASGGDTTKEAIVAVAAAADFEKLGTARGESPESEAQQQQKSGSRQPASEPSVSLSGAEASGGADTEPAGDSVGRNYFGESLPTSFFSVEPIPIPEGEVNEQQALTEAEQRDILALLVADNNNHNHGGEGYGDLGGSVIRPAYRDLLDVVQEAIEAFAAALSAFWESLASAVRLLAPWGYWDGEDEGGLYGSEGEGEYGLYYYGSGFVGGEQVCFTLCGPVCVYECVPVCEAVD